jgi:hypothetical protein
MRAGPVPITPVSPSERGQKEADMRRQITAVIVGIIVAVVVIYAVFDQRVSFRNIVAAVPGIQSHAN